METGPEGLTELQDKGSKVYVYGICVVAALGGLLFGYDTAVISGTVGSLEAKFSLSPLDVGWVAGSVLLGCMVGGLVAGPLSDGIGRKKALLLSALLFLVSAVGSVLPLRRHVCVRRVVHSISGARDQGQDAGRYRTHVAAGRVVSGVAV